MHIRHYQGFIPWGGGGEVGGCFPPKTHTEASPPKERERERKKKKERRKGEGRVCIF